MALTTLVTHATKLDAEGEIPDSWIMLEGGVISATGRHDSGSEVPSSDRVVDAGGAVVTPGLIDLHAHGGAAQAFDDEAADLDAALALHRAHGTTRHVLSLVANPISTLTQSLERIAARAEADPLVLGAHLEGPFLAPGNKGAHSAEHLVDPSASAVGRLLDAGRGFVRMITVAPELPGALEAIATISAAGAVAAVGHTVADYEQSRAAFDRGATVLTHAFNAMPGIHHRAPGPVVAALDDPRVTLEVILDGVHVHPRVARLLFAAAPDRIALITDAMAAAGAPDGDYLLGELAVTVRDRVALLTHGGAIAGSTLTQDVALRLAIVDAGLSPSTAVAALTRTPARALGLEATLGMLAPGFAADLVLWDAEWAVTRVWAAGVAGGAGAAGATGGYPQP